MSVLRVLRVLGVRAGAGALFIAAFCLAGPSLAKAHRGHASAKPPVVVELFTAQGCSACPQGNALLGELASKSGVIALTFPVDYWDYLGWADTFARPEFTARQRAYVSRLKLREIYTPEMVVNGRKEARGFDRAKVAALVDEAQAQRRRPLSIRLTGGEGQGGTERVSIGAGPAPGFSAEVWLVRYDPAERTVKVKAGENRGKTVVEENVVRDLVRLGSWAGHAVRFKVPGAKGLDPTEPPLSTVVLVQGVKGGPVIAAGAFPPKPAQQNGPPTRGPASRSGF